MIEEPHQAFRDISRPNDAQQIQVIKPFCLIRTVKITEQNVLFTAYSLSKHKKLNVKADKFWMNLLIGQINSNHFQRGFMELLV